MFYQIALRTADHNEHSLLFPYFCGGFRFEEENYYQIPWFTVYLHVFVTLVLFLIFVQDIKFEVLIDIKMLVALVSINLDNYLFILKMGSSHRITQVSCFIIFLKFLVEIFSYLILKSLANFNDLQKENMTYLNYDFLLHRQM